MTKLFIIIVGIVIIGIFVEALRSKEHEQQKYRYKRKDFFMSRAEHECYDALVAAVGETYYVFPQVNLPSIIDSRVVGQNWQGAFRHISQKSVDYVLCDKTYISPKLAIELDDSTHMRDDRKERDIEVERILKSVGLPLLRLKNHGRFVPNELLKEVSAILG